MTKRLPAEPAPGLLEGYAARFDDLFDTLAARQAFRRNLEGLLLPGARPQKRRFCYDDESSASSAPIHRQGASCSCSRRTALPESRAR
jgi:hypothetical protein